MFHKTKFADEVQQVMRENQGTAHYLKVLNDIARKHFANESDIVIQQVKDEVARLRAEDLAQKTSVAGDAEPATIQA